MPGGESNEITYGKNGQDMLEEIDADLLACFSG